MLPVAFHFSAAAPGESSDQAAIEYTDLPMALDDLPLGVYIVGDAAYTLTDKCLTLFTVTQRSDCTKYVYNFFLCKVRLWIEVAFGLLTVKWQPIETTIRYV